MNESSKIKLAASHLTDRTGVTLMRMPLQIAVEVAQRPYKVTILQETH